MEFEKLSDADMWQLANQLYQAYLASDTTLADYYMKRLSAVVAEIDSRLKGEY